MEKFGYILEESCICIKLRRIAFKVTEFYDKILKPAGISATQYSLLVNLRREEGCCTGELAERMKLEKSTLVRTLQPLLQDGFIVEKTAGIGRRRCLCLTPAGKEVLQKAFPLWRKAQKEVTVKLGVGYDELVKFFEGVSL
jgi:DNA-binding MarR family transcriptional regulator